MLLQGSPELLEVKMGAEGYSEGSDENNRDLDNDDDSTHVKLQTNTRIFSLFIICIFFLLQQEPMDTSDKLDLSTTPQPSVSKEPSPRKEHDDTASGTSSNNILCLLNRKMHQN